MEEQWIAYLLLTQHPRVRIMAPDIFSDVAELMTTCAASSKMDSA